LIRSIGNYHIFLASGSNCLTEIVCFKETFIMIPCVFLQETLLSGLTCNDNKVQCVS
jgi:hypothetical protein